MKRIVELIHSHVALVLYCTETTINCILYAADCGGLILTFFNRRRTFFSFLAVMSCGRSYVLWHGTWQAGKRSIDVTGRSGMKECREYHENRDRVEHTYFALFLSLSNILR